MLCSLYRFLCARLRRQTKNTVPRPVAGVIVRQDVALSSAWFGPDPWKEPTTDEILLEPKLYSHATFVLYVLDENYLHVVEVSRDVYKYLRDRGIRQYDELFHNDRALPRL